MDTAACAFCGQINATTAMEMTGHGWRCVNCSVRSQIDKARGGNDMAEHLTPQELQGIVSAGRTEALAGIGLAALGGVLTVATLASGASIVVVFTGMIAGGFGMAAHGLHRSRKAAAALRNTPSARVVSS